WTWTQGSDGMAYGGTYPGCKLLRYDPVQHTLQQAGRASDHAANLYCRYTDGGVPGMIVVSGGMDRHFSAVYDLESGRFYPLMEHDEMIVARGSTEAFIRLEAGGRVYRYDPATLRLLDAADA